MIVADQGSIHEPHDVLFDIKKNPENRQLSEDLILKEIRCHMEGYTEKTDTISQLTRDFLKEARPFIHSKG